MGERTFWWEGVGSLMFQGATQLSLDSKGRITVPSGHRDALQVQSEGRLVMTAHPHRCLLLYPRPLPHRFVTDPSTGTPPTPPTGFSAQPAGPTITATAPPNPGGSLP